MKEAHNAQIKEEVSALPTLKTQQTVTSIQTAATTKLATNANTPQKKQSPVFRNQRQIDLEARRQFLTEVILQIKSRKELPSNILSKSSLSLTERETCICKAFGDARTTPVVNLTAVFSAIPRESLEKELFELASLLRGSIFENQFYEAALEVNFNFVKLFFSFKKRKKRLFD